MCIFLDLHIINSINIVYIRIIHPMLNSVCIINEIQHDDTCMYTMQEEFTAKAKNLKLSNFLVNDLLKFVPIVFSFCRYAGIMF
jgi:hypothetical protein